MSAVGWSAVMQGAEKNLTEAQLAGFEQIGPRGREKPLNISPDQSTPGKTQSGLHWERKASNSF